MTYHVLQDCFDIVNVYPPILIFVKRIKNKSSFWHPNKDHNQSNLNWCDLKWRLMISCLEFMSVSCVLLVEGWKCAKTITNWWKLHVSVFIFISDSSAGGINISLIRVWRTAQGYGFRNRAFKSLQTEVKTGFLLIYPPVDSIPSHSSVNHL